MMNGFTRRLRMTTILACCAYYATAADAQTDSPGFITELDVGIESFQWEEFDDNGNRLLTETGPRVFLTGMINKTVDSSHNNFILEAALKGYAGKVDYDGQDSNSIAVSSKTQYTGYNLDFTGGYRITGNLVVDMLAGVGIDAWRREISASQNAQGGPVNGIVEDYTIQYFTLAAGFPLEFPSHEGYLEIGLRQPFSTREQVDRFNVTLAPQEKTSGTISYKFTFNTHQNVTRPLSSIMFYYESFRFDDSPAKVSVLNSAPVQVKQPESNMDIVGVAFGHTF